MAIFNGQHIKIDYNNVKLTEELMEAMETLDHDCAYGCGGTWEIYEENPDFGFPYRAVFVDMATDELVWNSEAGNWTDDYEFDEDNEEDGDEEDGDEDESS